MKLMQPMRDIYEINATNVRDLWSKLVQPLSEIYGANSCDQWARFMEQISASATIERFIEQISATNEIYGEN